MIDKQDNTTCHRVTRSMITSKKKRISHKKECCGKPLTHFKQKVVNPIKIKKVNGKLQTIKKRINLKKVKHKDRTELNMMTIENKVHLPSTKAEGAFRTVEKKKVQ